MALDTGRTDRTELSRWTAVSVVGRRLLAFARQVVTTVHAYAVPWMQRQPLWKICTKTLGRRVMVANLFGWLVLVGGLAIFNRYYEHIIDVKVDALRTQAQMIAVAIASNAKADTDRIIFEIDRPLETEGARIPFRDDSFARNDFFRTLAHVLIHDALEVIDIVKIHVVE